jgi:hypothetical protein
MGRQKWCFSNAEGWVLVFQKLTITGQHHAANALNELAQILF